MTRRRAGGGRGPAWPWVLTVISLLMLAAMVHARFISAAPESWIVMWGFVPAEINALLQGPPAEWLDQRLTALFTALFVHGSWSHLAGNLAYFWVFGITVERALGHGGMAAAFLLLGALANLILAWQMGENATPVIGASGSVSAIIGIYLGLFPVSRMGLWLPLGLYLQFARVPAILVIGSWFTLQLIYTLVGPQADAVAWWAHVAGFLAGVIVALGLRSVPGLVDLRLQDE